MKVFSSKIVIAEGIGRHSWAEEKLSVLIIFLIALGFLLLLTNISSEAMSLSPCDFVPPESLYTALHLEGNYRFLDDQSLDDRNDVNEGVLQVSYSRLQDSPNFGVSTSFDSRLSMGRSGWAYQGDGSINAKRYLRDDIFYFADLSLRSASRLPIGANLSAGVGQGRFRDVTPLAKAIHIQNLLLDLGALISPLPDQILQELAQELAPPLPQELAPKLQQIANLIEATELVASGKLGAAALFWIEEIVRAPSGSHLCGWEIKGSVGLEWHNLGQFLHPEAAALAAWNYALVPDPVSQLLIKTHAALTLTSSILQLRAGYSRRIQENLQARLTYVFLGNRAVGAEALDSHHFDISLAFRTQRSLSITVSMALAWETGYQGISKELLVLVGYDLL